MWASLLLTVGMIWRLQWSGTCNDIVNTLQPTCHQLSSANGSPVNCVIIQSGVRRQKPAVTCEEEPFQGCNAATKPRLHIFLLTFGHFMPVYVLLSRCSEHVATWRYNILQSAPLGDWFVTPHPAKCNTGLHHYLHWSHRIYAHFIWILINSPMFCFGSLCVQ